MELNKIYNEDCLKTMARMPNNFVDMTITSPPYNTGGQNARTGKTRKIYDEYQDNLSDNDYKNFIINVLDELLRVTKHYIFFNFQILTKNKSIYLDIISKYNKNIKDIFIWQKTPIAQIVKGKLATGYELVLILGKDNSMIYNYHNFPKNNYVPNIYNFKKKKNESGIKNLNTATMPIQMCDYFIINFTKENDIVYDCFMGTGTTAISSVKNDRKYIGSEISKKYINTSCKRLNIYKNQTKLF